MAAYGMPRLQVLRAATSVNAKAFHLDKLGWIKKDHIADIIGVYGNPEKDLKVLRKVHLVIHNGGIIKNERE
jgi:imidazolonepropionase-like amidohydrolase